jgi:hypothetical protein
MGRDPSPSSRRRGILNRQRRLACFSYTTTKEARRDGEMLGQRIKRENEVRTRKPLVKSAF